MKKTLTNALTSAFITTGMASAANAVGDARVDGNATGKPFTPEGISPNGT